MRGFQARIEGEGHHYHENILRYVQKAPDDIRWVIDQNEFYEHMATKESASCPDGIPNCLHQCAGGVGSECFYNDYNHVLQGGVIAALFAESTTVFHPQVFRCRQQRKDYQIAGGTTFANAVLMRLQDSHLGDLPRPSLVHHEVYSSLSEMHLFQALVHGSFLQIPHAQCFRSRFFSRNGRRTRAI